MATGVFTIRLERPPEAVFPLVANLERAPEWVPDLVSVTKQTPGAIGPGTRYSEVVRMGNNTGTGQLEVVEYEPPLNFMHKGESGPARFVGRFTLEPDGSGTLLTHEYTVKLKGLFRFLDPLIGGWVGRNAQAGLANLSRIIDG
jgi:carbon monoxide dehydrogenase subunit G